MRERVSGCLWYHWGLSGSSSSISERSNSSTSRGYSTWNSCTEEGERQREGVEMRRGREGREGDFGAVGGGEVGVRDI